MAVNALDIGFLVTGQLLAVGFLLASIYRGVFRRYLFLNLYVASMVAADGARQVFLHFYGVRSDEYFYAYFGSDFCIVVLKYVAIISIFEVILQESPLRAQARAAFLVFFGLVGAIAYAFISGHPVNHFYKSLI